MRIVVVVVALLSVSVSVWAQPAPESDPPVEPASPVEESATEAGEPAAEGDNKPAESPEDAETDVVPTAPPLDPDNVIPEKTPAGVAPGGPAPALEPRALDEGVEKDNIRESGDSSFMDVRLNFSLTNENVFASPGETIPSVPGWRFGKPNSLGTLFFENYDTRFSGFETLSHAVMYKNVQVDNYDVEGALVIRINDLSERDIRLSDAGSYMRVAYWLNGKREANSKRLSLVVFPTSADRMRLGYSWRLSWGGSDEYARSRSSVPGMKFQFNAGKYYAYMGAKSAIVLNRDTGEEEAVLAGLVGGGIDITKNFTLEFNGGIFDRGNNELQDVIDQKVILAGVSVQAALHDGIPVGTSVDYVLYRNDPTNVQRLFQRPEYRQGLSWLVAAEATMLGQTLKDPEVTGGTTVQRAYAGDVNARLKYNRTRFRLDLQARNLAYILHTTPSLPTYSDFPDVYDKTPNYFAAVGMDHNFDDFLTLGLIVGLEMPATLKTPTGMIPGDTVPGSGSSTAVVRSEGNITILPEGESAVPQIAGKFRARIDFARYFAAIGEVYYAYDGNQTRLERTGPMGLFERRFGEFNQLGFNFALQARF